MGIGLLRQYHKKEAIKVENKVNTNTCRYCGKTLKTNSGRASHERACSENPENQKAGE